MTAVPALEMARGIDGSIDLWAVDLGNEAGYLVELGRQHGIPLASTNDDGDTFRRAARTALRLILAAYVGMGPARRPFSISRTGKPSLAVTTDGAEPAVHFNLAHCETVALVGISRTVSVGVDIETQRQPRISEPRRKRLIAAARVLAPLDTLAENDSNAAFLQAWVRLEAHAKATGEGLGSLLGRLDALTATFATDGIDETRIIVRDVTMARAGLWAAVAAPSLSLASGPPPTPAWIDNAQLGDWADAASGRTPPLSEGPA